MNAPARFDAALRLEAYPHRLTDNVRFADLDPNQHVNNVVYAVFFETSRVTLVHGPGSRLTPKGCDWVLVRLDTHFRAELHWPAAVQLGLRVAKIGRTSVRFDQAIFSDGRCVATASATTVLIDAATRKPTPLPDEVVSAMQGLMR